MNRKKRRVLVGALAALLALLILLPIVVTIISSASAASEDALAELQEQAAELAAQQEELSSQINDLEMQQAAVMARRQVMDERVEVTRAEIKNLTQQIELYDRQIAQKEAEYAAAQQKEAEQFTLFKRRVRAMEENGTISYYSILFGAKDFSDLLSRLDFVTEIMDSDERVMTDLEQAQQATESARLSLEDLRGEAEQSRKLQEEKEAQLLAQIDEAMQLMAELEQDREAYLAAMDENTAREEALSEEISEMIAELDRIAAEEEERRRQEAEQMGQVYESSGEIISTGSYIWPASSLYITSPYGWRVHPIWGDERFHSGADIGADYGTDILAADSGVVITSTYDDSYGNYVMIAHGDGRYTLYAHMSERYASEGDYVAQGETIGLVGMTGWANGPHLHFEIYEGGERVDPLDYFDNWIPFWD